MSRLRSSPPAKAYWPWELSFSHGRTLQAAPRKAGGGRADNVSAGRAAVFERAKANGEAALGQDAA